MPAAKWFSSPTRMSLCLLGLGIMAAGMLVGVALSPRGSDFQFAPIMAERQVTLPGGAALFAQRFEVTIAEWNACAAQSACRLTLRARPDQDPRITPATGLSYVDVQEYVAWITHQTEHDFRLPTVQEWQFMAASVLPDAPEPLFKDPALSWASSYLIKGLTPRTLKPQGSFSTSPEGISDLNGSVWEWTQECYDGADSGRCPAYFVGGEHVAAMSYLIRDPARGGCAVGSPPAHLGLRLVTDKAFGNS